MLCVSKCSIDLEEQDDGLMSNLLTHLVNARRNTGQGDVPGQPAHHRFPDTVNSQGKQLSSAGPSDMEKQEDLEQGKTRQQLPGFSAVDEGTEDRRCRGLERTLVRRRPRDYDSDIEQDTENGEGDDDACDGCVDRPHVPRKSTGEKEEGDLEYDRKTLDEEVEWPLHLRRRSPQRSTTDPPVCRRYRFSHCFPSIAMNAANSDIRRLAYRRSDVVKISVGGPFHGEGAVGSSSGAIDLLRLRRIARRYASERSVGSGSSFDWTSMTKAELTAENRPAWGRS